MISLSKKGKLNTTNSPEVFLKTPISPTIFAEPNTFISEYDAERIAREKEKIRGRKPITEDKQEMMKTNFVRSEHENYSLIFSDKGILEICLREKARAEKEAEAKIKEIRAKAEKNKSKPKPKPEMVKPEEKSLLATGTPAYEAFLKRLEEGKMGDDESEKSERDNFINMLLGEEAKSKIKKSNIKPGLEEITTPMLLGEKARANSEEAKALAKQIKAEIEEKEAKKKRDKETRDKIEEEAHLYEEAMIYDAILTGVILEEDSAKDILLYMCSSETMLLEHKPICLKILVKLNNNIPEENIFNHKNDYVKALIDSSKREAALPMFDAILSHKETRTVSNVKRAINNIKKEGGMHEVSKRIRDLDNNSFSFILGVFAENEEMLNEGICEAIRYRAKDNKEGMYDYDLDNYNSIESYRRKLHGGHLCFKRIERKCCKSHNLV